MPFSRANMLAGGRQRKREKNVAVIVVISVVVVAGVIKNNKRARPEKTLRRDPVFLYYSNSPAVFA